MIRRAAFALACAAMPLPATAFDAVCHFTVECFETEACDAANFELRLRPGPQDMSVRLGSVADEVSGEVTVAQSGATVVLARGPSSFQLLSILDGVARYTLHLTDGPAVVTYHGTCEDQ